MRSAAIIAIALLLSAGSAGAASLRPMGTFDRPIYVTSAPDDPDQLFVAEREGLVLQHDETGSNTFADLRPLVSCCESERGLLSIAIAPDFATSGRFYAAYTGKAAAGGVEGNIHVDAFRPDGTGGLGREPIIEINHSTNKNHNGGQLQFGPDGYLYVSIGDGGGGGDPFDAGQSLGTLLGKLLRIDPRPGDSPSYAIPPGNPFAGAGEAALDEIWAYGLRNPWRFSFDRENGDLVIADVGQGAREEINRAPSPGPGLGGGNGANYGWDCREGTIEYTGPSSPVCEEGSGFTDPVFDYPHADPEDGSAFGCSITGGYVVRDASLGDLYGRYVYGDFCASQVRSIDLTAADPAATDRAEPGLSVPSFSLYSFGEDSCGRVYVVSGGGGVSRLEGATPAVCPPPEEEPPPGEEPPQDPPTAGTTPVVSVSTLQPTPIVTSVRFKAASEQVTTGSRTSLTASVLPCERRDGQRIRLNRGGRRFGSAPLNDECRARFNPRILHRSTFRVFVPATGSYLQARSARLTIYPLQETSP